MQIFMNAKFFFVITHCTSSSPALTIHVVALPIILTRGVGACNWEEKEIEIMPSRFEF